MSLYYIFSRLERIHYSIGSFSVPPVIFAGMRKMVASLTIICSVEFLYMQGRILELELYARVSAVIKLDSTVMEVICTISQSRVPG